MAVDENLFNECLAEMVIIMDHLLPKLKGGGKQTDSLVRSFESFKEWRYNILTPKIDVNETKKIHDAFNLILEAYDRLGLSRIN